MKTLTSAPPDHALSDTAIDVWHCRIDLSDRELAAYLALLTAEEQQRAARFRVDRRRHQFIVTRGLLRQILQRLAGPGAAGSCIREGAHGKPGLDVTPRPGRIEFNISHSGQVGLVAMGLQRQLGIDVEQLRPDVDIEALARRFFSENEYRAIMAMAAGQRQRAFFACWTRKEALVKAHGKGLALGLQSFDVQVDPDQPPALLAIRDQEAADRGWQLTSIDVGPGYLAALASDRPANEVRNWCAW